MSNILDKVDKSLHVMTCNEKAPVFKKRNVYAWNQLGDPGVFMMIDKSDLNIDGRYQRDQVSKDKVLKFANKWDWKLFGALSVVLRNNNTFWVYDGGHRARASFYRDDIRELPCMVFEMDSVVEESQAYVGSNTYKSFLGSYGKYKGLLEGKDPVAMTIQKTLAARGYRVTGSKEKYGICSAGELLRMFDVDKEIAEKVVDTCIKISVDGENIPHYVLNGFFYLARKFKEKCDFFAKINIDKMIEIGIRAIETAIRREKNMSGKGGEVTAAIAILSIINKGKREKLVLRDYA